MDKKEIWLPVKGYEGLYEVSSFGRVRSLNYMHTGKTNLIGVYENEGGYLYVCLHKSGNKKNYLVHRLVAEAFIPNWFGDPQINHIDEDKTNNHIDNLEWCDAKYNNTYGNRIKISVEKQTNGKKSKPVIQYTKTGEFVREWPSISEVGRNGLNLSGVCRCCLGKKK